MPTGSRTIRSNCRSSRNRSSRRSAAGTRISRRRRNDRPGPSLFRMGVPMKITALETIQLPHLGNIIWLQIHTDEGIVGLGETFRGADAVATYLHREVAPMLIGQNPLEIDRISKLLTETYVGFRSSGVEIRAASA